MNLDKHPMALSKPDTFFMDRFFDTFWRNVPLIPAFNLDMDVEDGMLTPRVNVIEEEKVYQVTAELPGIPKENIDISVADGVLTIKAHKESETKDEKKDRLSIMSVMRGILCAA